MARLYHSGGIFNQSGNVTVIGSEVSLDTAVATESAAQGEPRRVGPPAQR